MDVAAVVRLLPVHRAAVAVEALVGIGVDADVIDHQDAGILQPHADEAGEIEHGMARSNRGDEKHAVLGVGIQEALDEFAADLIRVLESTIDAMEKLGADRSGIVAAIGPLIRQHSYEVGPEFLERFLDADAEYARFFLPGERNGHAMFDLAGFIRMRLENAGVLMIDDIGVDTYSDERFYSYRRSVHRKESDYGRHVHAIALERE